MKEIICTKRQSNDSNYGKYVDVMKFTKNMRSENQEKFNKVLLDIENIRIFETCKDMQSNNLLNL